MKLWRNPAHDEGIFEIVDLLDQMRGELPLAVHLHVFVPDIPLVEAKIGAFGASGFRLDVTANRINLLDLAVDRN